MGFFFQVWYFYGWNNFLQGADFYAAAKAYLSHAQEVDSDIGLLTIFPDQIKIWLILVGEKGPL